MPRFLVRVSLFALLVVVAALPLACGDDEATTEPEGEQVQVIHLTTDFTFEPSTVTIEPGTTVRWVNDAQIFHTITPRDEDQPGVWEDHDMNDPGQEFEHIFTESGQTYEYFCQPHQPDMTGRIIVE